MTGQPRPLWSRTGRGTILGNVSGRTETGVADLVATTVVAFPVAAPTTSPVPLSAGRDDDMIRIRDRRILKLDLRPDDRVETGLQGGTRETHRAIQATVIGDGQSGQAQLHGPGDQLIRRRSAIEEREVGVRVQFGVGDARHEIAPVGGRVSGGRSV
jgi:hypothetical protein